MKDIKKEIDLPIQLQNDVKMIHQGCYFTYQQDTTYYLYINEVGIGALIFIKMNRYMEILESWVK